jgi:hypothetical protein
MANMIMRVTLVLVAVCVCRQWTEVCPSCISVCVGWLSGHEPLKVHFACHSRSRTFNDSQSLARVPFLVGLNGSAAKTAAPLYGPLLLSGP